MAWKVEARKRAMISACRGLNPSQVVPRCSQNPWHTIGSEIGMSRLNRCSHSDAPSSCSILAGPMHFHSWTDPGSTTGERSAGTRRRLGEHAPRMPDEPPPRWDHNYDTCSSCPRADRKSGTGVATCSSHVDHWRKSKGPLPSKVSNSPSTVMTTQKYATRQSVASGTASSAQLVACVGERSCLVVTDESVGA